MAYTRIASAVGSASGSGTSLDATSALDLQTDDLVHVWSAWAGADTTVAVAATDTGHDATFDPEDNSGETDGGVLAGGYILRATADASVTLRQTLGAARTQRVLFAVQYRPTSGFGAVKGDSSISVASGWSTVYNSGAVSQAGADNVGIACAWSTSDTDIDIGSEQIAGVAATEVTGSPAATSANYEFTVWERIVAGAISGAATGTGSDDALERLCALMTFGVESLSGPGNPTLVPPNGSVCVALDTTITLTFVEDVVAGTGDFEIANDTDSTSIEDIAVGSGQCVITGNQVVLTLTSPLPANKVISVTRASGVVVSDVDAEPDPGGTWTFNTNDVQLIDSGAVDYGTTALTPAYPTAGGAILADDLGLIIVGQKPSSANGGTATDPSGWDRGPEMTGATDGDTGGYSTTLGADTGNTNLYSFSNELAGGETGTVSVTTGTVNSAWAVMLRFRKRADLTWAALAGSVGKRTQNTTPAAGSVSEAMAADPGVEAGDCVVFGMCAPTDVNGTTTWSAQAVTQTGITYETAAEAAAAASATGNDSGGWVATTRAASGTSSAAPTVTATKGGTTTNARGPILFLRLRAVGAAGAIVGALTNTATTTGALGGLGALASTPSSTATVTGTLDQPSGAASASLACTATSTGALTGQTALNSALTSTATTTPAIAALASLACSLTASATCTGTLIGTAQIAATPATTATATGALTGDTGQNASLSTTATPTAALTAQGALAAPLVSSAACSGALGGLAPAEASCATTAATTGTLGGRGALATSLASTATTTGALGGRGALASALACTAAATGALTAIGALAASASTSATVTGTFATETQAADLDTTATAAGAATGFGALAGSASTSASCVGTAGGYAAASAACSSSATATGTASATGALAATPSTTAAATGTATGLGALAGACVSGATCAGSMAATGALAAAASTTAECTGLLLDASTQSASCATSATVAAELVAYGSLSAGLSTGAGVTASLGAIVNCSATLGSSATCSGQLGNFAALMAALIAQTSISAGLTGWGAIGAALSTLATCSAATEETMAAGLSCSAGATGLLGALHDTTASLSTTATCAGAASSGLPEGTFAASGPLTIVGPYFAAAGALINVGPGAFEASE